MERLIRYTGKIGEDIFDQGEVVSGVGKLLPDFEENCSKLNVGDKTSFEIKKAYGEYRKEFVRDLDRKNFPENIEINSELLLELANGQKVVGKVLELSENKVKIDLNHPLAGKDLLFEVECLECRE